MSTSLILHFIKSSKKYSTPNFKFDSNDLNLIYSIGKNEYTISITETWRYLKFTYYNYKLDMDIINVSINKDFDEKKVLSKFRELIRYMDRVDLFINSRLEQIKKIEPVIKSFIKETYCIEPIFDEKTNLFRMSFPKTVRYIRRRGRTFPLDVKKETPENLKYDVFINLKADGYTISLQFNYDVANRKLILERREESYRNSTKDITKIIRGEKIRNIIFKNNE